MTSYADFIVIASGTSSRQVAAIGDHVEQAVSKAGGPRTSGREGYEQGVWVLVDFGEAVVHVFEQSQRELFDLEGLWETAAKIRWNPNSPPKELFGSTPSGRVAAPAKKERKETTRVAPSRAGAKRPSKKAAAKGNSRSPQAKKKKTPMPGRSRRK